MSRLARALAAALPVASPALAQDGTVSAGEREYPLACAVCHGESGMGAGP